MLKGINVILSTRATADGLMGVAARGGVGDTPQPDMEMPPQRRVIESCLTVSGEASAAALGENVVNVLEQPDLEDESPRGGGDGRGSQVGLQERGLN